MPAEPSRARAAAALLLPALLAVLVHLGALGCDFVYDDVVLVRDSPLVAGPLDLRRIFRSEYWAPARKEGLYRPLTVASFAVLGPHARAQHAANLALHAGVTLLVALLARALLRSDAAAAAAGALFAVHPAHVEAIVPVVGRSDLLGAGLALAAVLLGLRPGRMAAALSGVLFLAALLAKESSVLAVLLLVLTALARGSPRAVLRPALLVSWGAAAAACALLKLHATGVLLLDRAGISPISNPIVQAPFAAARLTALRVVALYAERLLVPLRLASDYSFDQIPTTARPDGSAAAGALFLAALALVAVRQARLRPVAAAGAAFLGLALIPASNLIAPLGTIAAERILYLPSVGLLLLAAAAVASARRPRVALAVAGAIALLLAVRSAMRVPVYRDAATFFARQVEEAPRSANAHANLGYVLLSAGRVDEAFRAYAEAARIAPAYAVATNGAGLALAAAGREAEAIPWYRRAVASGPGLAQAWANLAPALARAGDRAGAARAYRALLALEPERPEALLNLAAILADSAAAAEAIPLLERHLRVAGGSFEAWHNLALAHARSGIALEAGLAAAREAVRLRPEGARAQLVLAELCAATGREDEARSGAARAALLAKEPATRARAEALARRLGTDGG